MYLFSLKPRTSPKREAVKSPSEAYLRRFKRCFPLELRDHVCLVKGRRIASKMYSGRY